MIETNTNIPTTKQPLEKKSVLHEAGYIINDMIHEEIEKQGLERKTSCYADPSSFSLDTQLKEINPLLLVMSSITATIRERKHPTLGRETDTNKHLKKEYIMCYAFYSFVQILPNQH